MSEDHLNSQKLNTSLSQSPCPACGYQLSMAFLTEYQHPLATLGWPDSESEALNMNPLPLDFVRCLNCGHVYNQSFDYKQVPYVKNPNLMYNKSELWQAHMESLVRNLLEYLPPAPKVLEIGCGEGELLSLMQSMAPKGEFVGFDPNTSTSKAETSSEIRFFQSYFEPQEHLQVYKPQMIITRHVLEHLMNPLAFLLKLCFFASHSELPLWVFIEVPCIDNALKHCRLEDFYYEHNSHFTRQSFEYLLQQVSDQIEFVETAYGDEVIYGLAKLKKMASPLSFAQESLTFQSRSYQIKSSMKQALSELVVSRKKVAIWGGTGKAAAFLHYFEVDPSLFPLVVDSDPAKIGTYVPGKGQKIQDKSALYNDSIDVIIIATQWRAKDIVQEIKKSPIQCRDILLEFDGVLVSWDSSDHPYG